ncbi:MAG: hypothetical protein J5772_08385 [Clostridia bacterium]|nr:hypothetical protein [Clostridia bacterium]
MKLLGVEKQGSWLYSEWNLTYRVGWENILRAAALIFEYTDEPEILTGDAYEERRAEVSDPEGVLALEENGYLIIRGLSQIIKVPLMITFYNQLDLVRAAVACAAEEFEEADYRRFNLSMCQFMDSIELAMYNA